MFTLLILYYINIFYYLYIVLQTHHLDFINSPVFPFLI